MSNNLVTTNPIVGNDLIAAMSTAVKADETALFGASGSSTPCDLTTTALTAPAGVAVAVAGTAGSTSYTYVVVDVGNAGTAAQATGVANTTGNATLGSVNYLTVTWTAIPGHTYKVYRSASSGTPSTTGLVGTVTATTIAGTFSDTGIAGVGSVPSANTTGALVPAGPVIATAAVYVGSSSQVVSTTATTYTMTVANTLNAIYTHGGGATPTITLPSASVLVAAVPGIKTGTGIGLAIRNRCSGSLTIAVGSGGVVDTAATLTLVSSHTKQCFIQVTGVDSTTSAESYNLFVLSDTAM